MGRYAEAPLVHTVVCIFIESEIRKRKMKVSEEKEAKTEWRLENKVDRSQRIYDAIRLAPKSLENNFDYAIRKNLCT